MALDRAGIADAFANLLKADTGTLYGTGKMLQKISSSPKEFETAKVSSRLETGLYMWISDGDTVDDRIQNTDDLYTLDMRFVGNKADPDTAIDNIDDAFERCKVLIRNQMYEGQYMTSYYTDSNAQFVNIDVISSVLPAPDSDEETTLVFVLKGAVNALINRWV